MRIRSLAYGLVLAASVVTGLVGGLGSNAGQIIGDGPTSLKDMDLSVFETRLRGIAEEYGVQFKPEGQAFSGVYGDVFLVRLGLDTDCRHTAKCVYVLFRNTEDESPFVTICTPEYYDLAHSHRSNGVLVYTFVFSCGTNSKFVVKMSPYSVFVGSYHPNE